MKKKYNIIYSLGADCACAIYLNKNDLRKTSGPFDWLTHAPLANRLELIIQDFKDFFNFEDVKLLPRDGPIPHDEYYDYYENLKNSFYYYHDFPKSIPLETAFKTAKEKYQRRISRFTKNIVASEKVLLVWLAHNHVTHDDLIKDLCHQITQKYNKNIDFLLIENDETKKNGAVEVIHIASNITKYKMLTAAKEENGLPTTLGNEDNCNKIFEQLEIIEPLYLKILNGSYAIAIKTLCLFIPNKEIRRWLKNYRID